MDQLKVRLTAAGVLAGLAYGLGLTMLGAALGGAGHGPMAVGKVFMLPFGVAPLVWGFVGGVVAFVKDDGRHRLRVGLVLYYFLSAGYLLLGGDSFHGLQKLPFRGVPELLFFTFGQAALWLFLGATQTEEVKKECH